MKKAVILASIQFITILFVVASSAHATLIGGQVDGCLNPDAAGGCSPTFVQGSWSNADATIVDPGVEFTGTYFVWAVKADFDDDTLVFTINKSDGGVQGAASRQVEFIFSGIDPITSFSVTGGNLTPSSTGFTDSSIQFSLGSLGLGVGAQQAQTIFHIGTTATAVPEPMSVSLLAFGLLGAGAAKRRRG